MKLYSPQTILLEIGRVGYMEQARIAPPTFKRMKELNLLQSWGGHVVLTKRGLAALHNRRRYTRRGQR